ncbi:MAG TPA: CxxC-x17-CxxC domain-containing protein [Candidatus Paceibacterota bacterium]|nr:CxxC-x17-CxxC domain-containing protein [Candidatus Paceibacterota bacterium]
MAEYKKQYRSSGSFQRPFSKGSGFASKELFDAECNSCHNRCQVPFRPNGKKPVYCSNCFTKGETRTDTHTSSFHSDSQARPSRSYGADAKPDRGIQDLKRQIDAMNETLKSLVVAVDTFNRATALTLEIQKHFPSAPKESPVKKAAPKKSAAKATKTVAKKTAKK